MKVDSKAVILLRVFVSVTLRGVRRYDGIEAKHKVDEEVQRCAAALRQLSEVEAARVRRISSFSEQRLRLLDGFGGLLGLHEELRGALESSRGPVAQAASFYHRQMAAVAESLVPAGYARTPLPTSDDHTSANQGLYSSRNPLSSADMPGPQQEHNMSSGQATDQASPPPPFRSVGARPTLAIDSSVQRQSVLLQQGAALYAGAGYGLVSVHGGLQRRPIAVPVSTASYIRDPRERLVPTSGVAAVVPGSPSALYPDRREFVSREVVGPAREYRANEL